MRCIRNSAHFFSVCVFLTVVMVLKIFKKYKNGPYRSLFGSSPIPWEPCNLSGRQPFCCCCDNYFIFFIILLPPQTFFISEQLQFHSRLFRWNIAHQCTKQVQK